MKIMKRTEALNTIHKMMLNHPGMEQVKRTKDYVYAVIPGINHMSGVGFYYWYGKLGYYSEDAMIGMHRDVLAPHYEINQLKTHDELTFHDAHPSAGKTGSCWCQSAQSEDYLDDEKQWNRHRLFWIDLKTANQTTIKNFWLYMWCEMT